jgi:hypothetical protein
MAHHLVEVDRAFLRRTANVLLVRDPAEVVVTLAKQLPDPQLRDVGVKAQCELLDELRALGQEPPVLDAKETLLDPEGVLRELCRRLGIAFDPAMLSWPAGRKPYFGVWAPHWYQNVERSTGFERYRPRTEPAPERLRPRIDECRPWYAKLQAVALKARAH